jgi:hypothetical protein
MSPSSDPFAGFPQQVRFGTERPSTLYARLPGFYAVHNRQPGTPAKEAVHLYNDGAIAVYKGTPENKEGEPSAGHLSPVYGLQPSGQMAIPTGLVFIRFKEGVTVESRRKEIEQEGYEIKESLSYAPNAGWLRTRSGEIADALKNIPALEKLPGVQNVEPQMLMASARR